MIAKICVACKVVFFVAEYREQRAKYCSRSCLGSMILAKSGAKTRFKKGENTGEQNVSWKGDDVGYHALHDLVQRWKGIPERCEQCGRARTTVHSMHWANKSGKYLRDLKDWLGLCASCHKKFDMTPETRTKISKAKMGSIPWNKGTKGICKPNSGSFKKGIKHAPEILERKRLALKRYWQEKQSHTTLS